MEKRRKDVDREKRLRNKMIGKNVNKDVKNGGISMRKAIFLMLFLAVFSAGVLVNGSTAAASDINVVVNGKAVVFPDQKPYIDENVGRMYVPIRAIGEALGASVTWDTQVASLFIGYVGLAAKVDSNIVYAKGKTIYTDAPVRLVNGCVVVPLRVFTEALGAQVTWIGDTNTVDIVFNTPSQPVEKKEPIPWEFYEIQKNITHPIDIIQGNTVFLGYRAAYSVIYVPSQKKFIFATSALDEATLQEVKTILKVFFPNSYEQAYQYLMDTRNTKEVSTVLDGRKMSTHCYVDRGQIDIGVLQ